MCLSMIPSNLLNPIYLRPWGSMSTIIAHNFLSMNKLLEPNLAGKPSPHPNSLIHTSFHAGLLLGAILSDTLNLQSPTSTDMDALMVGVLSKLANVEDPNQAS